MLLDTTLSSRLKLYNGSYILALYIFFAWKFHCNLSGICAWIALTLLQMTNNFHHQLIILDVSLRVTITIRLYFRLVSLLLKYWYFDYSTIHNHLRNTFSKSSFHIQNHFLYFQNKLSPLKYASNYIKHLKYNNIFF